MMLYSALLLSLLAITSASDRWDKDPEMSDVDSETTIGGSSDTFDPNAPHPAIPGCSIENGLYGDSSGSAAFIEFVYEVETAFGATATMDRIIGDLEVAIAEKALPTLFSAECGSRRMLRRRLAAIGVSTLPTDEEIEGLTCEVALANDNNPCTVVDGIFTLYTDGVDDGLVNEILSIITTAGNNGEFNDAHEDVVRVAIIAVTPDGSEGGEVPPNPPPVNDGNQSYIYVAVAAGAVLVIGAAIFYRRRRGQSSNVDADSTIMTPSLNPREVVTNEDTQGAGNAYDLSNIN